MLALLFELSDWTQIEMTGRDRQSFLHGFCTNDIKRLTAGQGCEAFLANIKGRVIGHVWAFADDRRLCLESEPDQAVAVMAHLDRYLIAEDVQLVDRTTDWRLLLLTGDGAREALIRSGLCLTPPERVGGHVAIAGNVAIAGSGADVHGSIRRSDLTSSPNWTLSVRAENAENVRSQLLSAGATTSDAAMFESLRIEHGYPLFGVDLSDDNLVHESARVQQTVSFNKGCYLGQEPIARLDSLGHVNRQLCRLRIATDSNVVGGARLLHGSNDGEEVGRVTSAARDPDGSGTVAIALVKRLAATSGTVLKVEVESGVIVAATVMPAS